MPADTVLPPRGGGTEAGGGTSTRAEQGAESVATVNDVLCEPTGIVALAGALMHGSLAASGIVSGEVTSLPTSMVTVALSPLATFCVTGPTPTSSLRMVTLMSARGRTMG